MTTLTRVVGNGVVMGCTRLDTVMSSQTRTAAAPHPPCMERAVGELRVGRPIGQTKSGRFGTRRLSLSSNVPLGGNPRQPMTPPHTRVTPERLTAFSDAVFAVLITVLVLELRPPQFPTFQALLLLWPTWLSYAISYLF